jgi:hypothetical protein
MSGEGGVYSGLSARARTQLQREFTGFAPGGLRMVAWAAVCTACGRRLSSLQGARP